MSKHKVEDYLKEARGLYEKALKEFERESSMGRTLEKIKMWNILDEGKIKEGKISPLDVEAQIDNGSTDIVLPEELVNRLGLIRRGKTRVKYANGTIEEKEIAHGVMIEILGRVNVWSAIIEPRLERPLIGQIVLEALDLWIDSKSGKLVPNPSSPEMPLLEVF